jgi:DNA-binding MarR family transcriptional regulator
MENTRENATNRAITLIFSVSRQIKEKYRDERKKSISGMQLETLRYIKEKEPLMKEIADYLCIAPPSATSLVGHLAKAGLAKRIHDDEDRRIVRLCITEYGKKELKVGEERIAGRMKKILSSLSGKEKESLAKILKKITEANN